MHLAGCISRSFSLITIKTPFQASIVLLRAHKSNCWMFILPGLSHNAHRRSAPMNVDLLIEEPRANDLN